MPWKYSKQINLEIVINFLYIALIFVVPLVFFTGSSEIFEFNKIVAVYAFSVLIVATWIARIILARKIIFRRTSLDYFLVFFLATQALASLVSIDTRTSFLGYYSRFHGGLLSSAAYSLLYWGFVSNFKKANLKYLFGALFATGVVASVWAVMEHFGLSMSCVFVTGELNVDCWVQDIKSRPFATFGQPNWLAGWLVAVLPLVWILKNKLGMFISGLFFLTLLLTRSRSGLLGLAVAFVIFWAVVVYKNRDILAEILPKLIIALGIILILIGIIGTPFGSSGGAPASVSQTGTVLETGGTESGDIRKIVWNGAIELWRAYPILGTGVETFGYSYYLTRPVEHNTVSEWNFLYNRAHNEYLNFLATTGLVGFMGYASLILGSVYVFSKERNNISIALGAGYSGILVTNFFGFSVVPVALLFFLYPAIAVVQSVNNIKHKNHVKHKKQKELGAWQKIGLGGVGLVVFYLLFLLVNYWRADYFYSQGKKLNRAEKYEGARQYLEKATALSGEPVIHDELADAYAQLGMVNEAVSALDVASKNSRNVVLLKSRAAIYSDLAIIDSKYIAEAISALTFLQKIAPTDASVSYRLGIAYAKIGQMELAIEALAIAIEMKPNYKEARFLLGAILDEAGDAEGAREQYQYILENISPSDKLIKEYLEELDK